MCASPVRSKLFAAALATPLALAGCTPQTGDANPSQQALGSLGAPNATFGEDFGAIQTVRELADGRVLVADPLGGALYAVDMDAGTRTQVGTEGQGPGEYRQPDAVWPLPGGGTLLVDLGNGRFHTIDGGLEFGDTSPLSTGDPRTGLVIALPQAVDADGNVYSRSMGGGMGQLPDSGAVLRIDRGSFSIDTVAMFKLQDRVRTVTGGANNQSVSISEVPLSNEDAWGVTPDGSVVVARSADYHVEWFGTDGSIVTGAAVAFDRISIGTAEKEEWLRAQGQSGGGIGVSVEIQNGRMQTSFSRGGPGGQAREIDQYDWPDAKPPLYGGRIPVDPAGRAWVRRHVEAGEDATYDVFDRTGARIATHTLPNTKRVIGFGAESVYVVAFDEFDLNYLERYDLPR